AIEAAPKTPSGDARPRICRVGAISTLPAPRPTAAAPTAPARRTLRRETPLLLAVSRLASTTSVIRPTSSLVEQCTRRVGRVYGRRSAVIPGSPKALVRWCQLHQAALNSCGDVQLPSTGTARRPVGV